MIKKFVTFDLTFTLIRVNGSVGKQYSNICKKFDYQLDEKLANENFRKLYKLKQKESPNYGYSNGKSSRTWWTWIVQNVLIEDALTKSLEPDTDKFEKIADHAYDEFVKADSWQEYPGCRAMLDELVRRRFTLGMISNFDERLPTILKNLNLHNYFSFVVIPSENKGLVKPNPEVFRRALELSGAASPDLITHVGNDVEADYFGALNSNFQAILLSHDSEIDQELIKRGVRFSNNFQDLLKLIN